MSDRRIILERRAAFIAASLAALGCGPEAAPRPPSAPSSGEPEAKPVDPPEVSKEPEAEPIEPPSVSKEPEAKRTVVAVPCLSLIVPTVRFPEGQSAPTAGSIAVIEETAAVLRDRPELRLEIEGHRTANEPPALSRARAARVEADLAAAGVDPSRLCLGDHGATRPLADPSAGGAAEVNRRVAFRLLEADEPCDDPGL